MGSLWVLFVLIDGDWYVCCYNDQSGKYPQLACTDKNNITAEEKQTIARLKNKSWVIGVSTLLCVIIVAALVACAATKCSNKDVLYYNLILEEEEKVLEDILRKAAKDKLTEAVKAEINDGQRKKCSDVAARLIEEGVPTIPAENQGIPLREMKQSQSAAAK
ncbi:uncharacterized protein AKAME5_002488500 [Lates japonicus]|uniref:Uncharacterized protein n=1 Tax=Lates japonicus TaxID=270547 RepID=A0AAD3RML4_LATJO|nr:uncharacterized protein AKAME5_002488500 [Lates japonicus]